MAHTGWNLRFPRAELARESLEEVHLRQPWKYGHEDPQRLARACQGPWLPRSPSPSGRLLLLLRPSLFCLEM